MFLKKLDSWQQSKPGLLITGLIALGLAYVFGSSAIDSGSLLDYVITILLGLSAIQNFYMLSKKMRMS